MEDSGTPRFLAGHFLISEINLRDPNFRRTVVLLVTHDESGAFGLVVNRPSRFTLGDLVRGMEGFSAAAIPVFIGGPVQQEVLFLLHDEFPDHPAEAGIGSPIEGVVAEPATLSAVEYLKSEWSELRESERSAVRLYAGYSGWAPGQLETELRLESWLVMKATREIIFPADAGAAWEEAFASKGPLHRIILETGFKPSMN
jgi:putative transcriptional regulator